MEISHVIDTAFQTTGEREMIPYMMLVETEPTRGSCRLLLSQHPKFSYQIKLI